MDSLPFCIVSDVEFVSLFNASEGFPLNHIDNLTSDATHNKEFLYSTEANLNITELICEYYFCDDLQNGKSQFTNTFKILC